MAYRAEPTLKITAVSEIGVVATVFSGVALQSVNRRAVGRLNIERDIGMFNVRNLKDTILGFYRRVVLCSSPTGQCDTKNNKFFHLIPAQILLSEQRYRKWPLSP